MSRMSRIPGKSGSRLPVSRDFENLETCQSLIPTLYSSRRLPYVYCTRLMNVEHVDSCCTSLHRRPRAVQYERTVVCCTKYCKTRTVSTLLSWSKNHVGSNLSAFFLQQEESILNVVSETFLSAIPAAIS